jgi:hypothetical protein
VAHTAIATTSCVALNCVGTKTWSKTPKMNFCRLTIQEPIFSVSNIEFEGGDDEHGHGDHTFLVKQAQPSHN